MAARGAGAAARADAPHRRTFAAWAAHRRGDSMRDLNRRGVIGLVGGAAAWPLVAAAQRSRIPVLGILGSASAATYTNTLAALRKGLNEAGYVEGRDLLVDPRWAEFQYERLPAL